MSGIFPTSSERHSLVRITYRSQAVEESAGILRVACKSCLLKCANPTAAENHTLNKRMILPLCLLVLSNMRHDFRNLEIGMHYII